MCVGGFGPTLVNLEYLLNTDMKILGASLMVTRLGYFLGSLGGGILIDIINQEFLLGTATLFLGLTFALTPWAFHVHAFVALQVLRGINSGILEAGMYPRSGQVWSENTENRYCIS